VGGAIVRLQSVGFRLFAVVLAAVLPLAGAMSYLWWQALEEGRARELALLQARVDQVERDLIALRDQSEWVMSRMARRPAFRALNPAACDDEMAVMREVNPAFLAITLWDRDGTLVCSSYPLTPDQPRPKPHRKSFDVGIATDGLYLSNMFPGQITGLDLVTFTYPVKNAAGSIAGLLSIPVRSDHFAKLLESAVREPGSVAGITDRNLVLVARVPVGGRMVGKSIAGVVADAAPAQSSTGALVSGGTDGVRRLVLRKVVPNLGWRIFVGVDEEALFAGFRRQLKQGAAVFAIVAALSLGFAYLIARGISRPLGNLVRVADAVARGDRGARAPASGGGEIARLAGELNRMLDTVENSEKSLRRLAERLTVTLESITDAFFTLDHEWRFTYVNAEAERQLRRTRDDLMGKVIWEEFREAVGSPSDRAYREALRTMRSAAIEQYYEPLGKWFEGRVYPSTEGLAVYFRDVSERKRMEEALRASEDRFRTLAESSPDAIMIHQDFRIVYVNPAMVQLLRAESAADLVGESSLFMLTPEHVEAARRRSGLLYAGERQPLAEQTYVRGDGTSVDVEIAAAPLTFNGKPAAQVTARDVSVRKQAEKLLRASMARSRDLSARLLIAEEDERKRIAHDLHDQVGQELTALKIRLETAARTTDSPAWRAQALEAAAAAGETLQRVRQMSVDMRPPQLDALGLAPALRALVERQSAPGGTALHFNSRDFPGRLPAALEIVCFRVVQEALTNVLRHSGAANAWVDLSAGDGVVRVAVRDDGSGFDADKLLQPASSGLGLLGMRERCSFAGGTLDIRSQQGQGCTVTAIFPMSSAEA
jgi:two-component system sensor histidine kinase UhpB